MVKLNEKRAARQILNLFCEAGMRANFTARTYLSVFKKCTGTATAA